MKQKHILKWLGISLGVYLLYGVLTAILVPLPSARRSKVEKMTSLSALSMSCKRQSSALSA